MILTARPQAVRVAGLGSATETVLDPRPRLAHRARRHPRAARIAYWRAGIANPRELEGLVVEVPRRLQQPAPDRPGRSRPGRRRRRALEALVGEPRAASPAIRSTTRSRARAGSLPTNLSGGLKARGHPVGGTGLFQIASTISSSPIASRIREAQVRERARSAISHSIGGPGNNNYVTLIERSDSRRRRDRGAAAAPALRVARSGRPRARAARVAAARRRGAPSRPPPRSTCGGRRPAAARRAALDRRAARVREARPRARATPRRPRRRSPASA